VGLGLSVVLGAFTALLPVVLSKTPQAASELSTIWWLVVIMQPINALIFVWDGIYMGAKRFSFTAISMVLAAAVGCGLLALVLPLHWGLLGVWSALVAVNAVRAAALAVGYVSWGRGPATE
jgi:Na+-driven multidrug efflux pump